MRALVLLASMRVNALQLQTIPNFRDLGGLPAANGRVVNTGLLHRSGSPANASHAEATAVLEQLGVRVVLDLRGEEERRVGFEGRHYSVKKPELQLPTASVSIPTCVRTPPRIAAHASSCRLPRTCRC